MAKAKPARSAPNRLASATVAALRAKIDQIDRELVARMNERAKLAHQNWQGERSQRPAGLRSGARGRSVGAGREHNRGPLSNQCLQAVFRELISGSRALEKLCGWRIWGRRTRTATWRRLQRFGQSVEYVPVASIGAVFEEVNRGHCDYGLVPIENSTDGRIADTLDMFTRLPVQICGEVNLPIHHCLLGLCPRSEVQEVYSQAQPLSQCRNWLTRHLPQARTIEVTSTSTAAQLAKDKPGAAAIASVQAAVHYGLNVLAENIEDQQGNSTRFAVIGQHAGPRTGATKRR